MVNTYLGSPSVGHTQALDSAARLSVPDPPQISWKAQVRLCKRYRQLVARGKHVNQVVVASARELLAFVWAIACEVEGARGAQRPAASPPGPCDSLVLPLSSLGEPQPRLGATLGGVTRLQEILGPRVEAGAGRTQVRWYSTHGYQQERPASLLAPALLRFAQQCGGTCDEHWIP